MKSGQIRILMERAVDCWIVPYSQEEIEETKKTLHYDCWKISRDLNRSSLIKYLYSLRGLRRGYTEKFCL